MLPPWTRRPLPDIPPRYFDKTIRSTASTASNSRLRFAWTCGVFKDAATGLFVIIMPSTTEQNMVLDKTKELCQTILDQPNMQSIRQRIDAFMGDEKSRSQYENLVNKGQSLQQKQDMALPLSGDEISEFEKNREELLRNPVARGFLDAQEELHEVQQSVQRYVSKTLELGRLPTEEEISAGSCGSGCGCHHH
jgi:cell fate (sporulation/competence/biofilm development) regulator YlbF (YheA/YmcA/DUF963 family)